MNNSVNMPAFNEPTLGNGKICYIQIPAIDIQNSSRFYKEVFGWRIRHRSDGIVAFDDGVGQVSGTWVTGVKPSRRPGMLIYIMVDNIEDTIRTIIIHGGKITQGVGHDLPEITARFSDPAGNIWGIAQQ